MYDNNAARQIKDICAENRTAPLLLGVWFPLDVLNAPASLIEPPYQIPDYFKIDGCKGVARKKCMLVP
jgi:hypothetical protein